MTAIALPPTIAGDALVKAVAARGFVIGAGYGKAKATSFRIGHMGDHTVDGLGGCLDAVADALESLSRKELRTEVHGKLQEKNRKTAGKGRKTAKNIAQRF